MKTPNHLSMPLFALALLLTLAGSSLAQTYVVRATVSGTVVDGNSTIPGYEDHIEIQNFGMASSAGINESNPAGPASFNDIEVFIAMKIDRKAHPRLFRAAVMKQEVKFEIFEITEESEGVYRVDQEIVVDGYLRRFDQDSTAGDASFVSLSIWPDEIDITTYSFDPDGSPAGSETDKWKRIDWQAP